MQACELTGDMLQRMIALFEGLQVFPERMRQNLDLSGGLIMAEALMLELGKQIGRQRAHDAVYEAGAGLGDRGRPFRELLAEGTARERAPQAGPGRGAARPRPLHGPLPAQFAGARRGATRGDGGGRIHGAAWGGPGRVPRPPSRRT